MKILSFLSIIFLVACNKDVVTPQPATQYTITFSIDSALTSSGTQSLPIDRNGFYHLVMDRTRNQTLSRITGTLLLNNKPIQIPSPIEANVEWSGSHYWILKKGDTVGTIVKTYFNPYTGQLQNSQLPSLISQSDVVIPIVNSSSYSDFKTGKINTMIAPVYPMKGDTITILGKLKYSIEIPTSNLFSKVKYDSIQKSIRIICD
jgi:hypothetical protein